MKITVITVCYNAEKCIEGTVLSVLRQTYRDIEYIIIDGASTDRTPEILKKYSMDKRVTIYCEPDQGVYNAMNRGVARASGDYVIFMNAGDQFYDEFVLSSISRLIDGQDKKIFYGKIYRVHCLRGADRIKDFSKIACSPLQGFLKREMPCHQGIVAPLSSLKGYYFNENYRYCADFDWLIRCYKSGYKLINTDCLICRYDNTGLTSNRRNREQMKKESERILKKNFPILSRVSRVVEKVKVIY